MPAIAYLECSRCNTHIDPSTPQTVCPACAGALYVRYDLSAAQGLAARDAIGTTRTDKTWPGMWRYQSVLPSIDPVTLGEGWTPMLPSRRNANVFLKEEGANPTGTFKARGLALAITMARHYGIKKVAVPSAGNAGGAVAAYAAAAGIEAHIFMPKDVPLANQVECIAYGAHMTLVDGSSPTAPASSPSAKTPKAGSICPPSKSPSASKAKRPWATSSSSSSTGSIPTPSSTPPAAA
jgi:threonine synthase